MILSAAKAKFALYGAAIGWTLFVAASVGLYFSQKALGSANTALGTAKVSIANCIQAHGAQQSLNAEQTLALTMWRAQAEALTASRARAIKERDEALSRAQPENTRLVEVIRDAEPTECSSQPVRPAAADSLRKLADRAIAAGDG